jgi:hypothetical protein
MADAELGEAPFAGLTDSSDPAWNSDDHADDERRTARGT